MTGAVLFSDTQKAMLAADLDRKHVKSRSQAGRSLSYVESWHVIAEANRIFGFDGWLSETIECNMVSQAPREGKPGFSVSYVARVRITAWAGKRRVIRDGVGAGHGIDQSLGNAHESAIKEAESDARKRALMTFGNPFGLALYDKTQSSVSDNVDTAPAPSRDAARERIIQGIGQTLVDNVSSAREAAARHTAAAVAVARGAPAVEAPAVKSEASARMRRQMIEGLDACYIAKQLASWKKDNGKASGKWDVLDADDKAAVLAKLKAREAITAPKGAADPQAPLQ